MIFREGRKVAARSKILGIHSTILASLIGSNRWVMIININIIIGSMILTILKVSLICNARINQSLSCFQ